MTDDEKREYPIPASLHYRRLVEEGYLHVEVRGFASLLQHLILVREQVEVTDLESLDDPGTMFRSIGFVSHAHKIIWSIPVTSIRSRLGYSDKAGVFLRTQEGRKKLAGVLNQGYYNQLLAGGDFESALEQEQIQESQWMWQGTWHHRHYQGMVHHRRLPGWFPLSRDNEGISTLYRHYFADPTGDWLPSS